MCVISLTGLHSMNNQAIVHALSRLLSCFSFLFDLGIPPRDQEQLHAAVPVRRPVRPSFCGRPARGLAGGHFRMSFLACHSSAPVSECGTWYKHFYHGTERERDTAVSPPAIRSFVPSFCSRPVSFCRSQIGSKKFDTLVLDFLNLAGVKSAGRSLDRFHAHAK